MPRCLDSSKSHAVCGHCRQRAGNSDTDIRLPDNSWVHLQCAIDVCWRNLAEAS